MLRLNNMRNVFTIRNKKLFMVLFFSQLVVMIVPLIVLISYYVYSATTIKDELLYSQQMLLNRVQSEMDLRFESIYNVNDMLATSADVIKIADLEPDNNVDALFQAVSIQSLLRNAQINIESFDTFIYFSQDCSVLSTQRRYREDFISIYAEKLGLTKDEFLFTVTTNSYREHRIIGSGANDSKVLFMRALYSGKRSVGSVVTVVPVSSIINVLQGNLELDSSYCYMINETDSLCIGKKSSTSWIPIYQDLSSDGVLTSINIDGDTYLSSSINSSLGSWKYVLSIPELTAMEALSRLRGFIIVGSLFLIIVGSMVAILVSSGYYTPLQQLSETFSGNLKTYYDVKELPNVAGQILETIQSKNTVLEKELYCNERMLKNQFLTEIFNGEQNDWKKVSAGFHSFGMNFNKDSGFFVIGFLPVEKENSIFADKIIGNEEGKEIISTDLLYFSCQNVIEEMIQGSGNNCFVSLVNGMILCVVEIGENRGTLIDSISDIIKFHKDILGLKILVFKSDDINDIRNLPKCYAQLLDLHNYKKFWGDSVKDVLSVENLVLDKCVTSNGQLNIQKQLINLMSVKDYQNARKLILNEFTKNYSKSLSSYLRERSYILSLVSIVVSSLTDSGEEWEAFFSNFNIDKELFSAQSLIQLQTNTEFLLNSVISYSEELQSVKNENPTIIKIKEYIEKNYNNNILDVSYLADKFSMNVSYLSRTFKKEVGVGILDFIHQTRLKHCKEYLSKGSSVKCTAESCGYIDSKALIRAFKRYEAMTPGQWAEIQEN